MKIVFTATLLMLISLLHAQYGSVGGKVLNDHLEGIRKVSITVSDSANAVVGKTIFTDNDGNFNIEKVHSGTYNIQFSAKGYLTKSIEGILVKDDRFTFLADVLLKSSTQKKK